MISHLIKIALDIPEILKFGIIGFGTIMAILAFWLLRGEQSKNPPRRIMINAIFAFMFFSLVLTLIGVLAHSEKNIKATGYVVPEQKKEKVDTLPAVTYGEYKLIKDISIFDLRGWKPVAESEKNIKTSPANYINYLHVKKTKPIDKIVAHYSTSGADIDIRCITHNFKIFQQENASVKHPGQKNYGLEIDVSSIPLNEEFLVVIEATYWNGFSNIERESASTYTDKEVEGLEELALIVLLPQEKPVKEAFRFMEADDKKAAYREAEKYYIDQNKRFIYWSIKKIIPDTHYQLEWTW